MQMAKGKKTKKQLKKIAKKVVKKMAKRSAASNKPLTADEQSKQIEMMKTILSRQPNPAMALDPQYRDLIQKNQQLNEMKNQKEYYLNNMHLGKDTYQKSYLLATNEEVKKLLERAGFNGEVYAMNMGPITSMYGGAHSASSVLRRRS